MNKGIAILVAGLFLTMSVPVGFARAEGVKAEKKAASAEVVKGAIVSIDVAKGEVVIKDEVSGTDKTISVDAKTTGSLQVGERVKAKVTAGTNKAESVKKIKKSSSVKK